MRFAFAVMGAAVLTAAAPPARDWTKTVVATPEGGHAVGNPAARVRLVEYASYTCSHCADFSQASKPALSRLVRSGSTRFELRHLVRDGFDLSAVIVARCGGPRRFAVLSDAIFASQGTWLPRGVAFARTNEATLRAAPPAKQLRALANGSGLLAIGRAQGLTDQRLDACFADAAAIDRLTKLTVPPEVRGTPAFFINGRFVAAADWAALQPALAAAGARP